MATATVQVTETPEVAQCRRTSNRLSAARLRTGETFENTQLRREADRIPTAKLLSSEEELTEFQPQNY